MFPSITIAVFLSFAVFAQVPIDKNSFRQSLESHQPELRDLRCEIEGTRRVSSREGQPSGNSEDEDVVDTFAGTFVWTRDGNAVFETYHRDVASGEISEKQIIISKDEGKAWESLRLVDTPYSTANLINPSMAHTKFAGSYGAISLRDQLLRYLQLPRLRVVSEEEQVGGRRLLRLDFLAPDSKVLFYQYWVDLERGGHVIQMKNYLGDKGLMGESVVRLGLFEVNGTEIWMPVSGTITGYAQLDKEKRPTVGTEPTFIESIYVVDGTMEFNRRPPPSTFTPDYHPRTVVSDSLKQLQYEFGQQKFERITRSEAEAQLEERLQLIEDQGRELIAAPSRWSQLPWTSILVGVFGLCALGASILILWKRQ